jgi:hypothetical protein
MRAVDKLALRSNMRRFFSSFQFHISPRMIEVSNVAGNEAIVDGRLTMATFTGRFFAIKSSIYKRERRRLQRSCVQLQGIPCNRARLSSHMYGIGAPFISVYSMYERTLNENSWAICHAGRSTGAR